MSETRVPAIPSPTPQNLLDVSRALKQMLDVREGRVGDALDANVTFRDLIDAGLASTSSSYRPGLSGNPGFSPVRPPTADNDGYIPEADFTMPAKPTGFVGTSGLATALLSWDGAGYRNHAYTEVWRSETDEIGDAVLIGTSNTSSFADAIGKTSRTYYYWIRHVSVANVQGPYQSTGGAAVSTSVVGGVDLGDLIVTAEKLASSSVTAEKIANLAVGNAAIQNLAVTNAKIADLAADKITTGSLTAAIGVTTGKIYGGVNLDYQPGTSNFGTGFFLGAYNGSNQLYVGSPDQSLLWDGTNLTVKGTISALAGTMRNITIYDQYDNILLNSGGIPYSAINGSKPPVDATRNSIFYGPTSPNLPVNGDIWVDTTTSPYKTKVRVAGAWQDGATFVTDTNQLNDGAGLGQTSLWSGVTGTGRPADFATKNTVFRQSSMPSTSLATTNDLWFNTSDSSVWYFNGSSWTLAGDVTSNKTAAGIVNQGLFATLNKINNGNVGTYIEAGAITNAYIGNFIQSNNFNGTIDGTGNITVNGTTGWAIGKAGKAVLNTLVARGSVMGGGYAGYYWPAAGQTGFYLGSEGLLIGNYNNGAWFQADATGYLSVNGKFTASADGTVTADLIDIKRRRVLQTGTVDTAAIVKGFYTDTIYTGKGTYGTTNANYQPGAIIHVPITEIGITDIYDASAAGTTYNQPYYVAAQFTGSTVRAWSGQSGCTFSLAIMGQVGVVRTYSNAGNYPDDWRLVIRFVAVVRLVSGTFSQFQLPIFTWTLYKT